MEGSVTGFAPPVGPFVWTGVFDGDKVWAQSWSAPVGFEYLEVDSFAGSPVWFVSRGLRFWRFGR